MPLPVTKGRAVTNAPASTSSITITPDETIAVGDWMILTFMGAVTNAPTTPTGWAILSDAGHFGTRHGIAWCKMRASGETSYTFSIDPVTNGSQAVLMWGSGSDVTDWVPGTVGLRTSAAPSTTVAPSITTVVKNTLVLAIAWEASAATETGVGSITGATEWFFAPQGTGVEVHTLDTSYINKPTPGATGDVTIVYPNSSSSPNWNGAAVQIALVPSDPSDPTSQFQYWDGEQTINCSGFFWDGSSEIPFSSFEVTASSPVEPTAGLAFALPNMASSPRKVFAHWFPPFLISMDNADPSTDYWARNYLALNGESGSHASYGGYVRNRPKGRAPIASNYQAVDIQNDIDNARNAGLDGFFVDMLSASASSNNTLHENLLIATANSYVSDGSFKIVPMVDTTASLTTGLSTDDLSDRIAGYSTGPSAWYLDDGRYVVSSFKAETYNATWWDTLFTNMKTRHGLNVAFLTGLLAIGNWTNYQGYDWSYGVGDWGDGSDPGIAAVTGASEHSTAPHAAGLTWMQPVQGENVRPDQHVYDEAYGTGSLRGWWERAIRNNSEYVQLVTWSDYSESGSFQDSVNSGNVQLDISSYYITKWKTGSYPTILRDAVYLSHRGHTSTATFRSGVDGQTSFMSHWARGTGESPVADIVEVLTFLTDSADVTVSVGGTDTTYTAPAGVNAHTVSLAAGDVSVTVTRAGASVASVDSTVSVTATPYKDEWIYYRFSSLRGTEGQYNPNLV